jgi:nucleoside 2-deoxyribosyltransferase
MKYLIALPLLLTPAFVHAEPQVDAAPAGTIIRLSAEQIAALEAARLKRSDSVVAVVDEPAPTDAAPAPDRRPHGEVGFGIGTGGYSELFGTVVTPLGDDAFAAFSFYQQRDGRRKRSRR